MTQVLSIQPSLVKVGKRLRGVDNDRVDMLAGSIEESGLFHPIVVCPKDSGGEYPLVDGLHRLAACIKLGREIDIKIMDMTGVEERLVEVDANLMYAPLTALQRCDFLARRKEVYEELHPETKNGAQGGRGGQKNENGILPFSKNTAEKVGLSLSTIERAVAVAKSLSPAVKAAIVGTPLEDKRAELEALAKEPPARQSQIIKALKAEKDAPTTVKTAIELIDGAVVKADLPTDEKQFLALMDKWDRAQAKARKRFLAEIGATLTGDK